MTKAMPLWASWMLVTALAGTVAWFITAVMLLVSLGFAGIAAGTLFGFATAGVQTSLLEKELPHYNWRKWSLLSGAGGTLAWVSIIALMIIPQVFFGITARSDPTFWAVYPLVLPFLAGAIFGMSQWLVIRQRIQNSVWWIVANLLGCSIGGMIGVQVSGVIYENLIPRNWKGSILIAPAHALSLFVIGAVGSVILAIATGIAIMWLLRRNGESSFDGES